MMVQSLRGAKPTDVQITNYRKDGTTFTNALSLLPVNDSNGEYRYSIGLLSDVVNAQQEGPSLEKLKSVVPTTFDAAMQPKAFNYEEATEVDQAAQRAQFKKEMIKFTRLLWSIDWETALKQLVTQPPFQQAFGGWLQQNAPSDVGALQAAAQGNPEAVDALAAEVFVRSVSPTARLGSRVVHINDRQTQ